MENSSLQQNFYSYRMAVMVLLCMITIGFLLIFGGVGEERVVGEGQVRSVPLVCGRADFVFAPPILGGAHIGLEIIRRHPDAALLAETFEEFDEVDKVILLP
jgi:hypothetical protein